MINIDLLKRQAAAFDAEIDSLCAERFDVYARLLVEWNKKMNLTGITEPDEIVTKHFADSLALNPYLNICKSNDLADIGTGAGFPGLPLLIMHPDADIALVDAQQKRLNFLQAVLDECSLTARLVHARAEEIGRNSDFRETFSVVTARAVANMNTLCEYCLPLTKTGGLFIAMKGSSDDSAAAGNAISILGGETDENKAYSLENGDKRRIIIVKKISQTPTEYPRKSKKITSSPL